MENPLPLPGFTPRPPLSSTKPSSARHKRLLRRLRYEFPISPRYLVGLTNARCARIRLWRVELVSRNKQRRALREIVRQVGSIEDRAEKMTAAFALSARLHSISVSIPTFDPLLPFVHLNPRPNSGTIHFQGLTRPPIDPVVLDRYMKKGLKRKRR